MCRVMQFSLWLAVLSISVPTFGQGFLIDDRGDQSYRLPRPYVWPSPTPPMPAPPQSYKIKELGVEVNLSDQVAKVQVSQSFVNTGSVPLEVAFIFPLPYEGAIDRMTFMVDGKEFDAKLLDAKEARRIYEGYVRRNRDPALLEWLGTGMFRTNVFPVPPGAERVVTLRYSQLCRQTGGVTEFLFPMSTAKYTSRPIEKVSLRVAVQSKQVIRSIYSPTHSVEIKRPNDSQAIATYSRTNELPTDDFRLFYDVGRGAVAASVLSFRRETHDDGYFLMLASPEIKGSDAILPKKNVVFVVDRSGSMSGKKIEQARDALKSVLNNLREGDLFNIVAYDSTVESFRPEMQRFDTETRVAALGFIEGIHAGGSTNIDGALATALGLLTDNSRPNHVVFLTDGLATAGETKEAKIVDNVKRQNNLRARIFPFGVGYDVNSRLLDRLARLGFGQSEYVRPDEDIEASVSKLYNRIGAPVLTDLSMRFDMENFPAERGSVINRLYPRDVKDLFAGDQLVILGRYKQGGAAKVQLQGSVEGKKQSFDYRVDLADKSNDDTFAFIEKLWALRRVGEIIDDIDLNGSNPELVAELVALATKHGIVTQYTSFLADENVKFNDLAANESRATIALNLLKLESGVEGFAQRRNKATFQRAEQIAGDGDRFGGVAARLSTPASSIAPAQAGQSREAKQVARPSVLNVGRRTLLFRQGKWIDSSLKPEQEASIKKIAKYSDEYFEMLSKQGSDVTKCLSLEGDVILVLDNQAYEFSE